MRRTLLTGAVCAAGLAAGCGSSPKTTASTRSSHATPPSSPVAALAQTPGTLGPPPPGTRYDAVDHGFLQHLAAVLGHSLESRGLHNVNVTCSASVASQATCQANGLGDAGQSTSGTLKVRIDRTTGELRLTLK